MESAKTISKTLLWWITGSLIASTLITLYGVFYISTRNFTEIIFSHITLYYVIFGITEGLFLISFIFYLDKTRNFLQIIFWLGYMFTNLLYGLKLHNYFGEVSNALATGSGFEHVPDISTYLYTYLAAQALFATSMLMAKNVNLFIKLFGGCFLASAALNYYTIEQDDMRFSYVVGSLTTIAYILLLIGIWRKHIDNPPGLDHILDDQFE